MEDDDRLRESWSEALRLGAHRVIGSRDGTEALDLLRAVAPHLVILGLPPPSTSRVAILDEIPHILPLIRYMGILVISAVPDGLPVLPSGLNVLGVLAKPVPPSALVQAVRHALEPLTPRAEHAQIGTQAGPAWSGSVVSYDPCDSETSAPATVLQRARARCIPGLAGTERDRW